MNINMKNVGDIIFRVLLFIIGFIFGYLLINTLIDNSIIVINSKYLKFALKIGTSIVFGLILFLLSRRLNKFFKLLVKQIELELSKKPLYEIVFSSVGLIVGLLIAFLLTQLISVWNLGFFGSLLSLVFYIVLGYLGIALSGRNKDNILDVLKDGQGLIKNRASDNKKKELKNKKVLDTSAIIDGRILEIAKTGFLEGPLVLPVFILEELQHIADSSDSLKRNRGRRGLEVMNGIQALDSIKVIIEDNKYPEIYEVDSKLVKLALDQNAKIITNDFNLNKVAEVQGIEVLNINELANALKPVAIPGETMFVQIIKEGQEHNQGVAYLDDGTMIVVENGKSSIGQSKEVLVTSVLQTNAGKMIFAKIK